MLLCSATAVLDEMPVFVTDQTAADVGLGVELLPGEDTASQNVLVERIFGGKKFVNLLAVLQQVLDLLTVGRKFTRLARHMQPTMCIARHSTALLLLHALTVGQTDGHGTVFVRLPDRIRGQLNKCRSVGPDVFCHVAFLPNGSVICSLQKLSDSARAATRF